jgi:hypothetical protein
MICAGWRWQLRFIINPANRALAQEEKCDDSKEEMRSATIFVRWIIYTGYYNNAIIGRNRLLL